MPVSPVSSPTQRNSARTERPRGRRKRDHSMTSTIALAGIEDIRPATRPDSHPTTRPIGMGQAAVASPFEYERTRAGAARVIRREFAISEACQREGRGRLALDTHCGSVRIVASDRKTVSVCVEIGRTDGRPTPAPALDFDQSNDRISIRSRRRGPLPWLPPSSRLRLSFDLKVPRDFHVDVSTRGGSVEVSDIAGDVTVRTAGGWLTFRNIGGRLQAHTAGGGIEVDGCGGDVEVRTAGGPIDILRTASRVSARTTGGNIHTHFERAPRGRLQTSGGNLDVWFAASSGAHIDARTGGGQIEVEHGMNERSGDSRSTQLRGSVNGGGAALVLRTKGGSIAVRESQ